MNSTDAANAKFPIVVVLFMLMFALVFFWNASPISAHGGEDHGDEKPKAPTTTAGTVSRISRLGDFEVMLKHPLLEPDAAAAGRLFITKFASNEPFNEANPAIEIEPANGGLIIEISVEKTDAGGSYLLKIPALPEGAYIIRVKTTVGGKTDTITFSGVEIAHQEASVVEGGTWLPTILTAFLFLVTLGLFFGLIFFSVKVVRNKPFSEEIVSA